MNKLFEHGFEILGLIGAAMGVFAYWGTFYMSWPAITGLWIIVAWDWHNRAISRR